MSLSKQEEIGFRTQGERLALDENKDSLHIVKRRADRVYEHRWYMQESALLENWACFLLIVY